jgi:subtilase family serine protease
MAAFPQADLHWVGASPIIINPAAPAAGTVMTFKASVRASFGNGQPFQVVGGIDGVELFSQASPALLMTKNQAFSFSWTATPGNHNVYFEIDPNKTAGDLDYANNLAESKFTIAGGPTPPPPPRGQQPNLVIKNVTWNPQTFTQNDTLNVSFQVVNTGGSEASISYAKAEICGTTVGSSSIKALQPGDSDNITFSGMVSSCPAKVIIWVDTSNDVAESNENDNDWSQTLNCGPSIIQPDPLPVYTDIGRPPKRHREPGDPQKPNFTIAGIPNLTISDVDWSPKSFNDNQKVTITYNINNIGNGPAEPRPSTLLNIDGNYAKVNAPGAPGTSVPAGWSKKSAYVWNAKCGSKISIQVDPGNITVESNELDNTWEHTFGPPHCNPTFIPEPSPPAENLPNLWAAGMNIKKLSTSWNTGTIFNFNKGNIDADIEAYVVNKSNMPVTGITMWSLKIDQQIILTGELGPFEPGQEKKLGWYGTINCGVKVTFSVDVTNYLIESNEYDNSISLSSWPCK